MRAKSSQIPLLGYISFNSDRTAQEVPKPQITTDNAKAPKQSGGCAPPATTSQICKASSTLTTQSLMLLPAMRSRWLWIPLFGASTIALIYLVASLWMQRKNLLVPMGGPQWSPSTSFATNFTIGTGLLSLVCGGSIITDALHYITKLHYTLLTTLFAALLLLAPAIFSFFSTHQSTSSPGGAATVSLGSVWLFLLTTSFMIYAVVGQISVVALAIAEIKFKGYIGYVSKVLFMCSLATATLGTVVCAWRTVSSHVSQFAEQDNQLKQHLCSVRDKVASVRQTDASNAKVPETFTASEQDAIARATNGGMGTPAIHPWKMF